MIHISDQNPCKDNRQYVEIQIHFQNENNG